MGKKSKKGVSRANTKKHNAAGQGKSKVSVNAGRHGSKSCDNSVESNSVLTSNTSIGGTGSATTTIKPMPIVHIKEQLLQQQQVQNEQFSVSNDIASIATQNNNKENDTEATKSTISGTSTQFIETPTLLSNVTNEVEASVVTIAPTPVVDLNTAPPEAKVDTNVIEQAVKPNVIEKNVPDALSTPDEILPPVQKSSNDTDGLVGTVTDDVVTIKQETTENTAAKVDTAVDIVQEAKEVEQQPIVTETPVVISKTTTVSEKVPIPVAEVENKLTQPEEPKINIPNDEPVVTVPSVSTVNETKVPDNKNEQQIWSNTIRSIVSADEDEVLADSPIKKPVMDITPQKQSKLLVPLVLTVSPSPDNHNQRQNSNNFLTKGEPVPSLDTPDAKDVDRVKENLCGCTIM